MSKFFLISLITFALFSCGSAGHESDTNAPDYIETADISAGDSDASQDFYDAKDGVTHEEIEIEIEIEEGADEYETGEVIPTLWKELLSDVTADILRVKGDGAGNIYATGTGGILLKYRGEFVPVRSGVKVNLYGVAVSGGIILACGEKGTIIKNDGGGFEQMESGVEVDLMDIAILDEDTFYAVGEKGTIIKWNGEKWEKEVSGVEYRLNAIAASDKWGIWVVGNNGVLLEKKGGVWLMSNIANPSSNLNGIWIADNGEVFAVGTLGTIVKYDGFLWKQQLSNDTKERDLHSVFGFSEKEVYLAGSDGAIIKYDGKKWNTVAIEGPYNTYANFRGIWGFRDLTGTYILTGGMNGKFLRFDGESWKDFPSAVQSDINGLYADQEKVVFAGDNGLILKYNGEFDHIESGTAEDLNAVFGDLIAGNNGKMLRLDGDKVSEINTGTVENIRSLWISQSDKIYAVGESGLFLVGGVDSLSQVEGAPVVNLNAVFGLNDNTVFAAGDKGTLLFYDGKKVSKMPSPSSVAIHDIHGAELNNLYAVGDFGVVLKFSGSVWTKILNASETFLYGAGGGQRIFAVGWAGSFYELKEDMALKIETPYKYIFEDLAFSPFTDSYLLCGRKGVIIEYKP